MLVRTLYIYFTCMSLAVLLGTPALPQIPSRPQLALQVGHRYSVSAIDYSPDGKRIASLDTENGMLKVWDAAGRVVHSLSSGGSDINFIGKGEIIAVSHDNGEIDLWDVKNGVRLRRLNSHDGDAAENNGNEPAVLSADGSVYAVGRNQTIQLFDLESGKPLSRKPFFQSAKVKSIALSPNGKILASYGEDDIQRFWDVRTGALWFAEKSRADSFGLDVVFSPESTLMLSNGRLWDIVARKPIRAFPAQVLPVAISRTGLVAFYRSAENKEGDVVRSITIQNVRTAKNVFWFKTEVEAADLAFSPDGKVLAIGGGPRTASVIDDARVIEVRNLSGNHLRWQSVMHDAFLNCLTLSPDGRHVATGGGGQSLNEEGALHLWNGHTGELMQSLAEKSPNEDQKHSVDQIAYSPDSKQFGVLRVSWRHYQTSLQMWDTQTSKRKFNIVPKSGSDITAFAFSPDSYMIVAINDAYQVSLWEARTGKYLRTLFSVPDNGYTIEEISWSPDGKWIALNSEGVQVFDARTGKRKWLRTDLSGGVYAPDGQRIVASGQDGIVLLDALSGKTHRKLEEIDGKYFEDKDEFLPQKFVFSPDGNLVANAEAQTVWATETGRRVCSLQNTQDSVWELAFSHNGKLLFSTGLDETLKVWRISDGQLVARLTYIPNYANYVRSQAKSITLSDKAITFSDKELKLPAGEWFVSTPEGYFDCSANAARYVLWNVNGELYPAERYWKKFRKPELVRRALRGEEIAAPQMDNNDVPPLARFVRFEYEAAQNSALVTLNCRAAHALNEKNAVQILVNNRPLAPENQAPVEVSDAPLNSDTSTPGLDDKKPINIGDKAPIVLGDKAIALGDKPVGSGSTPAVKNESPYRVAKYYTYRISLPPAGDIKLRATCFDEEELGSAPVEIRLKDSTAKETAGNLYALCVGVSTYRNGALKNAAGKVPDGKIANLMYPDDDAREVAARLKREANGFYKDVEVETLIDKDVTLENLRAKFDWLQQKACADNQTDTVVVFLSGHGLSDNGAYFFPTYEFDASTRATRHATSLSGEELQQELGGKLRAKNVFLFVDTCHSGALDARSDDLSFQVQQSGVYLLASSGETQRSYEAKEWKHGAFTSALLSSLSRQDKAREGKIHFDVLTFLVPSEVARLMREAGWSDASEQPVVPLEGRSVNEPVARAQR